MDIAANYGPHIGKPLRVVFKPAIGPDTERSTTERSESWLPVLRHPLVVGAVLAILSGLLASLVIPAVTRVWQDMPKELALKQAVVERISQRATAAIAEGESFGASITGTTSLEDRVAFAHDAPQAWEIDGAGVESQLNTYFRGSAAAEQWPAFEDAVSRFLRYAAAIGPVAQLDELRDIAKMLKQTSFSDPAAESLRKEFVSSYQVFGRTAVVPLLDHWKDELTTLVLDSNASGFSHGHWFIH